jgi:spore coat protein CotF
MLATSKGTATAYFDAVLTSMTPELRAMFSTGLVQILSGHATLAELAVKYGWEKPYSPPTQQLADVCKKSTMERQ